MLLAVVRSLDLPFSSLTCFNLDSEVLQTKEKIVMVVQGLAFLAAVGGSLCLPRSNLWGRAGFLSTVVISLFANNAILSHLDKVFSGEALEGSAQKLVVYQMQLCGFVLATAFGRLAASDLLSGSRYTMEGIRSTEVLRICMGVSWIFRTLGYNALFSWLFFRFSMSQFSEKTLEGWSEKVQKMRESSLGKDLKQQINSFRSLLSSDLERLTFSQLALTASLVADKFWGEQTFAFVASFVGQEALENWYQSIEEKLDEDDLLMIIKADRPDIFAEISSEANPIDHFALPIFQEEKEQTSLSLRVWDVFNHSISVLVWATIAASRPQALGLGVAGGWVFSKIFASKKCSNAPVPRQKIVPVATIKPSSYLSYIQSLANRLSPLWFGASSPTAFYSGANLFFASKRAVVRIIEKK
ncbi:MAG: hypothetical protein IT584_03535 [Chlamydiae bacterium]|nr:hypothetical protein [Chlamydiota bacterium]